MYMKVKHFIEGEVGKVDGGIDQTVTSLCHFCFSKVDGVFIFGGIGPAQIIVKSMGSDITEDRPSVTPARRSCSPDVVDQFVVVEGKVTGDIAVPLGKRNTTAKVKFIIFPDSYHCRHVADDGRNLINSSTESPGFHGIFTEFLVEPVPVHNMKVGFISPVAV